MRVFQPGGIVDAKGRKVADLRVDGSSLVRAKQWIAFLDEYADVFQKEDPWVTLLVQSVINLHQSFIIMSRRMRKNEYWTGGMTMDEQTIGLVEDAEHRLAVFEKASEQVDQRGLPDWARFMFCSIQGSMRMQVRLAREAEQIMRKGHLLVNVNPRVDSAAKAKELGEETDGGITG